MSVKIRPAHTGDLGAARTALSDAGLPIEDLSARHLAFVAEANDRMVGVIGLESFGVIGLLRSLVVLPEARADGAGGLLVAALEELAREQGVEALWLLTIDADGFFERLGYRVMDRGVAPAAIQSTTEFSGLCPGDAVLMSKVL